MSTSWIMTAAYSAFESGCGLHSINTWCGFSPKSTRRRFRRMSPLWFVPFKTKEPLKLWVKGGWARSGQQTPTNCFCVSWWHQSREKTKRLERQMTRRDGVCQKMQLMPSGPLLQCQRSHSPVKPVRPQATISHFLSCVRWASPLPAHPSLITGLSVVLMKHKASHVGSGKYPDVSSVQSDAEWLWKGCFWSLNIINRSKLVLFDWSILFVGQWCRRTQTKLGR